MTNVATAGIWKPDDSVGADAKYMRAKDHAGTPRNRTVFFSADATKKALDRMGTKVFLCESPAKAIALQEALGDYGVTIGLNGVNGGHFRPKEFVPTPDGGKREKKSAERLSEDLESIEWRNRHVWIVFDNDVNTHKQAEYRGEKKGVIWAEEQLAELLRKKGAYVSLANFPYRGEKLGVDDLLHRHGAKPIVDWILGYAITRRDYAAILAKPEGKEAPIQSTDELAVLPVPAEIVAPKMIMRKCVTIFSAPEKWGKSLFAFNLVKAIQQGEFFLGKFAVQEGARVLYISYEMPPEASGERVKELGLKPFDYWDVFSADEDFCLNAIRSAYNSEKEIPENQGNLDLLERTIKQHGYDLVFIDPLIDAIDASPNDEMVARRLMMDLQKIARRQDCAVVLIHHTRKKKEGDYSQSDTTAGSANWLRKADAIITGGRERVSKNQVRNRIEFSLRYAEIDPHELVRSGLEMTVADWKAVGKMSAKLLDLQDLFTAGEIATSAELQRLLKMKDYQVSKLMKLACQNSLAEPIRKGEWRFLKGQQ